MRYSKTKEIKKPIKGWTLFWDMHSGGSTKVKPYQKIYIEAPQEIAEIVFYNKFKRNPHRITCTCCGEDYAVSDYETLEEASAYHRNCHWDANLKKYIEEIDPEKEKWDKYKTLEDYIAQEDVLVIRADEISAHEKLGSLPEEGYVWID